MQLDRKNEPVIEALREELKFCTSVLDIGCGQSSMIQYVPWILKSVCVEIWEPYIDESKKHSIHTSYVHSDVTEFVPFRKYDAVMCFDVIEHIDKDKAIKLIKDMITWADKKVLIYVPNGFQAQEDPYNDGNKYQKHVSAWSPKDFTKLGFKVIGYAGWKYFRSSGGDIRIKKIGRARDMLQSLADHSEMIMRNHPNYAFALLAIYSKKMV